MLRIMLDVIPRLISMSEERGHLCVLAGRVTESPWSQFKA